MFENIGWGEILVLILAGLFILGPERLPGAAQWLGKTVRQVREFASGARDQLKGELGPEYDELRKPLEDLRSLRGMNPRTAITKHLFDGYDPVDDLKQYDVRADFDVRDTLNGSTAGEKPNGYPRSSPAQTERIPLAPGERAPFDPDAT